MIKFSFFTYIIFCFYLIKTIHAVDWIELSVSGDGNSLVAISLQDGIYLSLNRGSNWIQTNAPTNLPWSSVSMSGDGRVIAATTSKHGIYLSVDSGKTWNQVKGTVTTKKWKKIQVSRSGKYLIACSDRVLSSEDYGETWKTTNFDFAIENVNTVSIDDSGQHRMVLGEAILTTKDYGESWKVASALVSDWSDVACSSDGRLCFAASVSKGIYSSSDYGQNWVKTSAPELSWNAIASDPKGEQISAVSADGIYLSTNYGATWAAVSAPSGSWISVAMTSEVSSIYALQEKSEMIYRSHDLGQTWEMIDNTEVKTHQDLRKDPQQEDMKDLLRGMLSGDEIDEIFTIKAAAISDHSDHLLFQSKSIAVLNVSLQPSETPTDIPSDELSSLPTGKPSSRPSSQLSRRPSSGPSSLPSQIPSSQPSSQSSQTPSSYPSSQPSLKPSSQPSSRPSETPSSHPSSQPSLKPSSPPSSKPSDKPSKQPSSRPSQRPSLYPSSKPSDQPTGIPSTQPSSTPSQIPSSYPSAQPTSEPTAPTFAPTQIPTALPSFLRTPQFMISATFTINGVNGTLTNSSLTAITQAIYATAIKPCTVKIISWYVVGGRRMLLRVVRDVIDDLARTTASYQVNSQILYNLVDFPNDNITYITMKTQNQIVHGVINGSFQQSLRTYARANGINELADSTCTNVTTNSANVDIPIPEYFSTNLTDGQIAGIILGSVIGVFLLLIAVYYVIPTRCSKSVITHESRYKPNNIRSDDMIVLEDNGPFGDFDDALTIYLDEREEYRQPTSDVTNVYEFRL